MKTSVFIATSLDGFIARTNGDIDWLTAGNAREASEDYGYKAFIDSVDVLVMGRHTYEKVLTFGEWPYDGKPVIVLSSRAVDIPTAIADTVTRMAGTPGEIVERLAGQGARHLYIDGGKTIQQFLAAGFIQYLIITRVPLLLGNGISLFGPLSHDVRLRHMATQSYANGFVQSHYEVEQ